MKNYIGAKIIKAEPMSQNEFNLKFKDTQPDEGAKDTMGYHVQYPDGYDSWSPMEVFDQTYREISSGELKLLSDES